MENHLLYNLREIGKVEQWPLLLSNFGFTVPALLVLRTKIENKALAWSCAVLLPLWFCTMMIVGVIVEIRIFTELISVLSLALALILYHEFWRSRSTK